MTLAAEALSLVADHVIYVNPRQLVRWQTRSPRIDCSPHFAHSLFSWANHQGREFSSTLGEKTMRKSRQPAYGVAALNWPEPIAPSMFLPNQALRSMVSRCTYIHAVTMPVVRVTQGAPVKARIIPHLIFCLPPALRFPLFHPLDYDRKPPPRDGFNFGRARMARFNTWIIPVCHPAFFCTPYPKLLWAIPGCRGQLIKCVHVASAAISARLHLLVALHLLGANNPYKSDPCEASRPLRKFFSRLFNLFPFYLLIYLVTSLLGSESWPTPL